MGVIVEEASNADERVCQVDSDYTESPLWRWGRVLYRPRLCRALFLIGFVVILVWRVVSSSFLAFPDGSVINTAIHYGSLLCLVLSSVFGEKRPIRMAVALCLFLLGAAVYLQSGDPVFVDLSVTLYACSLFPLRWTVKIGAIAVALTVVAVVMASQLGIVEDYLFPRDDGALRHGLGFLYCTFPSHYLLCIVLAYLYLRADGIRLFEYVPVLAVNFAVYALTDSRNSFLLVLVAVACSIAIRFDVFRRFARSRFAKGLVRWVFVACAIISIVVSVTYDGSSEMWARANSILSNRLEQTQSSLQRYGVAPFGRDIVFLGNGLVVTEDGVLNDEYVQESVDANFVDCSYMQILIRLGVVSLVASVALMTAGCWLAVSEDNLILEFCLVITALHSVVDAQLLELPYDLFLIVAFVASCRLLEDGILSLKHRSA